MYVAIVVAWGFYSRGSQTSFTARSELRKVLFLALWVFVCVWHISRTAERTCAKFTGKMCLVPRSDKFECQGQRSRSLGTKRHSSALSAACVRFMFGKTSLASSFVFLLWRASSEQYYLLLFDNVRCYQTRRRWQFCLSARQCTGASGVQHSPLAAARNPQFHFFQAVTATAQSWTRLTTIFRKSYSSTTMSCKSTNVKRSSSYWISLTNQ